MDRSSEKDFDSVASYSQVTKQFGRCKPLNPAVLEIAVNGPERDFKVQRQSKEIDIIRISLMQQQARFRQLPFVFGSLDKSHRECGHFEHHRIEVQPPLPCEESGVLLNFFENSRGRVDGFDFWVLQDKPGLPTALRITRR